ncbi:MAG: S4 domain-containing protein [Candidatus Saccharimonadales bacterium]
MSQAKQRLDQAVVSRGLALTRSQAENSIRLGYIQVDKKLSKSPGIL